MTSSIPLLAAAILAFVVGLAHSVLGEKYILMRLRREELPPLFGGPTFTVRTLRFAWHLTTIAWWGFAAMLLAASRGTLSAPNALTIIAWTMLVTGAAILVVSRGRHLAWPIFAAIGCLALWAPAAAAAGAALAA